MGVGAIAVSMSTIIVALNAQLLRGLKLWAKYHHKNVTLTVVDGGKART